jgi:hypothetical protein
MASGGSYGRAVGIAHDLQRTRSHRDGLPDDGVAAPYQFRQGIERSVAPVSR